jgi:hypothetical protein
MVPPFLLDSLADCKMQGFHPCTPLKGLLQKSLKNPQNLKNHYLSMFFKVFWSPDPFAIFARGEFAPNEVRMFPQKGLVGVRGQAP